MLLRLWTMHRRDELSIPLPPLPQQIDSMLTDSVVLISNIPESASILSRITSSQPQSFYRTASAENLRYQSSTHDGNNHNLAFNVLKNKETRHINQFLTYVFYEKQENEKDSALTLARMFIACLGATRIKDSAPRLALDLKISSVLAELGYSASFCSLLILFCWPQCKTQKK